MVVTGPDFTACSNFGNVHDVYPKAWLDDDHLIAIESEIEWYAEKRWGEPGQEPRGDRLMVVGLNGEVVRAISAWGAPIPEYYQFERGR